MGWKRYAVSVVVFNLAGFLIVYLVQRIQGVFPSSPAGVRAVSPDLAFNAAVSFTSNTNWQDYGGETTMSHVAQMLGFGVQNSVSAATGIAVVIALIRGFSRKTADTLGTFRVDLVRSVLSSFCRSQ
jgi:K+-transporting ATPase ATPase A chain